MGWLLVIIGLLVMIFVHFLIGLILIILGLVLFFVPGVPYGYGSWRRAP